MRSTRNIALALLGPVLLSLAGCGLLQPSTQLTVAPTSVTLDSSTPQTTVTLRNTSNTATTWTATSSDAHVTLSPAQGYLAAGGSTSVTVSVGTSGLSQGQTITPTVTFSSSVGNATLDVTFHVIAPPPSTQLTVTPTSVSLDSSTPQTAVTLANGSAAATSWTASTSDSHVSVTPAQGTLSAGSSTSVTVAVDSYGLSQGQTITSTVTFSSSVGNATLDVSFTMTAGGLAQCGQIPTTLSVASVGHGTAAPVPHPAAVAPDGRTYVPGEILVSYDVGAAPQGARGTAQTLQQLSAGVRTAYGLQLVRAGAPGAPDLVKTANATATLARLRADPRVKAAQLNYYLTPQAPVNDPYYNEEWTMQEFGVEQAWTTETGASNPTVIAIIDTGVQMNHPDLQAKIVGGCDFYDGDNNPSPGPNIDHGTHVAGIAAAIGNNNAGVAGVAYALNAQIEPIKIFDDTGAGATTSMLIDGIRWAAGLQVSGTATNPHPADVINMSVGVAGDQPLVDQAAADAFNAGSLLVASAGNYGPGTPNSTNPGVMNPANAPDVIAVGSVDSDHTISGFSAYGPTASYTTGVELMAPGGFEVSGTFTNTCAMQYYGTAIDYGILSTYTASNYGCDVGTSMASPFVAGVAALLKSQNPTWTPTQLRQRLDASVLFETGMTANEYGYGIVCADKVVNPSSPTTCGQ